MVVPQYGHIVVAQQENHAYSQLTGCATAPYINGTPVANGMLMNDDSGLFHPGEANCFALFGGKDYSITAKDPRVTATGPGPTANPSPDTWIRRTRITATRPGNRSPRSEYRRCPARPNLVRLSRYRMALIRGETDTARTCLPAPSDDQPRLRSHTSTRWFNGAVDASRLQATAAAGPMPREITSFSPD